MSAPSPQGLSVLVVEDDPAIRDGVREALVAEGCVVTAVEHARAALEHLQRAPAVDLVLLDLMTPVMDGWAFLEARRCDPRLSSIPVVVVSAHGGPTRKAPYLGVAAVVAKPIDPDALVRVVTRYARHP